MLARLVGLVVLDAGVDLRGDGGVVGERETLCHRRGVALGAQAAAPAGVGLRVVPGGAAGHRLDALGDPGAKGEDFGARIRGVAS